MGQNKISNLDHTLGNNCTKFQIKIPRILIKGTLEVEGIGMDISEAAYTYTVWEISIGQ